MERILQVVTHMNRGGLETMLMNYYRKLDREQIQFDFLTHREYDGDYGKEIRALGGKIYHLPVLNPFSNRYKEKLGKFFDEHPEYRVVHVHQDCLSSVILKVASQHGVKVRIAHSHCASQDKNIKYPIKMFFQRSIPAFSTNLLACSQDAGKWMFRGADFQVLNNAIDTKQYLFDHAKRNAMRASLGIAADELLVGHVGRFSPQKNHVFLIDIFAALQKKVSAKLIMVGEGDLQEKIKQKVEDLGLTDRVIFTGLRSDVADLLQAMDVFVFPSSYEGLGIAAIEAQASGLPCLISDKVPIECKKTDLVQQIPLSAGAERWAAAAIEAAKRERRNTYEEIKTAGFDIGENAKLLQDFYLRSAVGERNVCLY